MVIKNRLLPMEFYTTYEQKRVLCVGQVKTKDFGASDELPTPALQRFSLN